MPALDDYCSEFFRYRDLIECGATWRGLAEAGAPADNLPSEGESWTAIASVCRCLLDPLVVQFGAVELTYGFARPALTRRISRGIAPRLDQHAGHELRRDGSPICPRLGQAVDFRVKGVSSVDVARWLVREVAFDRLYLYGAERPLHVSLGPEDSRVVVEMRTGQNGQRFPGRTWRAKDWLAQCR